MIKKMMIYAPTCPISKDHIPENFDQIGKTDRRGMEIMKKPFAEGAENQQKCRGTHRCCPVNHATHETDTMGRISQWTQRRRNHYYARI
jgi:hypothetical protein